MWKKVLKLLAVGLLYLLLISAFLICLMAIVINIEDVYIFGMTRLTKQTIVYIFYSKIFSDLFYSFYLYRKGNRELDDAKF